MLLLAMLLAAAAVWLCRPQSPRYRLLAIAAARSAAPDPAQPERPAPAARWLHPFRHRAHPPAAGELALSLDLLAVVLAAGAPPSVALESVGGALPGQVGGELLAVSRALGLGSTASQAWAPVVARRPELAPVAERFARAAASGAALAPLLAAAATDQRGAAAVARARAVRRVGVLAALPLGLCFLPAFLLTGVLPLIAGLVAELSYS